MEWYYWLLIAIVICTVIGVGVWLGLKYSKKHNKPSSGQTPSDTTKPEEEEKDPTNKYMCVVEGIDKPLILEDKEVSIKVVTDANKLTLMSSDESIFTLVDKDKPETKLTLHKVGEAKLKINLIRDVDVLEVKEYDIKVINKNVDKEQK